MERVAGLAEICQGLARSGRGSGMRRGEWLLRLVESGDIQDDGWFELEGLREIELVRSPRMEPHLLRPFDLLVTARAGFVQLALVPPQVSRVAAGVTLLVARPKAPESGMGHYLKGTLSMVFFDFGLWPQATGQAADSKRNHHVTVGLRPR